MKKFFAFGIFILFLMCTATQAQSESPEYIKYHKEFMQYVQLMNIKETYKNYIPTILMQFKEAMGNKVPDSYWIGLEKEYTSAELDTFIEKLTPVYFKYLPLKDLVELNKFLSSPSGRAFVKAQMDLQPDAMDIAQAWGEGLASKIIAKLEKDGYSVK